MKEDSKNLMQKYDSRIQTCPRVGFRLCICASCTFLLAFCCLPLSADTETRLAQLDPTDFLTPRLIGLLEDANAPTLSAQVAGLQQVSVGLSEHNIPAPQEVTGVVPVNYPDNADHNSPEGSLNIAEDPNGDQEPNADNGNLERVSLAGATQDGAVYGQNLRLWRARISLPESEEDIKSKDELQRLIQQVYSIEFKRTKGSLKSTTPVESAPTPEPNETSTGPKVEGPEEPEEKAVAPKPGYEPVSGQTLRMLSEPLRHPEQLNNPFELGEVLFLSGHLKEAAILYREALDRKSPNQADPTHDRAWILLQIGNCLRYDDLPTAANSYRQLITEYPDSPWSDLAKAQYKLIEWRLQNDPRTLITEYISSDSLIKNGAVVSE